jgi:hypothetical protein
MQLETLERGFNASASCKIYRNMVNGIRPEISMSKYDAVRDESRRLTELQVF